MGDPPVKDETAGGGEKESTPSPAPLCWEGRALEARVLLLWCVQSCDLPGELSSLICETTRGTVTNVVSLLTLQAAKRHPQAGS